MVLSVASSRSVASFEILLGSFMRCILRWQGPCDGCNKFVFQPPLPKIYFNHPAPTWGDARRTAAAYFHRMDGVSLPDYFFGVRSLLFVTDTDKHESTSPASVSAHTGFVQPEITEWEDIFYGSP